MEWFNKEVMELPNLSDREHIYAYKHGLRSLSLTKVLAPKCLQSVDVLLDGVHEFIMGDMSVKSKRNHLEGGMGEGRSKRLSRPEVCHRLVRDRLTFSANKMYSYY